MSDRLDLKKYIEANLLDGDEIQKGRMIASTELLEVLQSYIDTKIIEAREAKDYAYWERNQLVGVLSRLYPSHLAKHPESDKEWEDDWRNIVCIHTPAGQVTWHLHDSDMPMFKHLEVDKDHWDGHTTEEKYKRLEALNHRKDD